MENKELTTEIKKQMARYFRAKDKFHLLTDENKMIVARVENSIAALPENSVIKPAIDKEIDSYFAETKELGDTKNMAIADKIKQESGMALVRKKEEHPLSSRAAFINVAILIYGVLNIGFILAIALMK